MRKALSSRSYSLGRKQQDDRRVSPGRCNGARWRLHVVRANERDGRNGFGLGVRSNAFPLFTRRSAITRSGVVPLAAARLEPGQSWLCRCWKAGTRSDGRAVIERQTLLTGERVLLSGRMDDDATLAPLNTRAHFEYLTETGTFFILCFNGRRFRAETLHARAL